MRCWVASSLFDGVVPEPCDEHYDRDEGKENDDVVCCPYSPAGVGGQGQSKASFFHHVLHIGICAYQL